MASKKKNLYIRKFLNPKKGTACIEVKFEKGNGNIKIVDCNRAVTLDFYDYSVDDDDEVAKTEKLHKIQVLIDCLTAAKNHIEGDKNNEAN